MGPFKGHAQIVPKTQNTPVLSIIQTPNSLEVTCIPICTMNSPSLNTTTNNHSGTVSNNNNLETSDYRSSSEIPWNLSASRVTPSEADVEEIRASTISQRDNHTIEQSSKVRDASDSQETNAMESQDEYSPAYAQIYQNEKGQWVKSVFWHKGDQQVVDFSKSNVPHEPIFVSRIQEFFGADMTREKLAEYGINFVDI